MTASEKEKIFLEIIDDHSNQIYRLCWGFTDSAEDVKDLYQEVVLNIWKGMDGFRQEAAYSTWIHKISINTCILWQKKSKPKPGLSALPDQEIAVEPNYDLTNENLALLELRKRIQDLKKTDKLLVILLLEGLTYKEIAAITGLKVNHVGVKINRIKSILKKQLNIN